MFKRLLKLFKGLPAHYIPLVVFFIATLYTPKDYDLGWHLKYGEYFIKTGTILTKNIFSTTLPDYHWISSSWLLDPILYLIFNQFGFVGISILGALVTTGILLVIQKTFDLDFYETALSALFLFAYLNPVIDASFRGQTVSLLLLALLLSFVKIYEAGTTRIVRILPFLFLIWVNVHTQYVLGLALLTIWTFGDLFRRFVSKKPLFSSLLFILPLCFFATLVNPRGAGIIGEIIRHVNDPSQKAIIEWLPFERYSTLWRQFLALVLTVNAFFFYLLSKKQLIKNAPWVLITFIMIIAGWWMRRYAWSEVIVAVFFLLPFIKSFTVKRFVELRVLIIFLLSAFSFWLVKTHIPSENVLAMSWRRYCDETVECTDESARFIIENKLTDKLWTFYGYGGWLIWNYPEIKPSMDGRMPSWTDENKYSPFLTYYDQEQSQTSLDTDPNVNVVYTINTKPIFNTMLDLVDQKRWDMVYEDDFSAIFVRNKPK